MAHKKKIGSSVAMGVSVEIVGILVEDAACLRKKYDYNHINVIEVDVSINGFNLALKWRLKYLEIRTDSATILSWMGSMITERKNIWTNGDCCGY